jgi:MoaA/NifB/PqqE/SkfB family radical SAM enzyme
MSNLSKARAALRVARSGAKGWPSVIWNTAMAHYRCVGPLLPPAHLAIEPTNGCNAKCPVCETGKNEMLRRKGMLDKNAYEKLIDRVSKHTNTLLLYFMGEPFLNKHVYDMIRYTRQKDIYVETCTNGDFVDAKGVIYSDINKISFQLGGMTEETHRRYRIDCSLARAHKNLHELIAERNRTPGSNVEVEVGFIVMRHNEHEVPAFLKWAKEIGVDTANIIDPAVRNMLEAYAYLPKDRKYWFYDEQALERGILKPKIVPHNECAWIWNSMQINWNGDAVPCCRDPNGKHVLGNVFEDGIMPVFNGTKAREFRRRILNNQGEVDICRLCSSYGLPNLKKEKASAFSVVRHSIDPELARHVDEIAEAAVSDQRPIQ